MTTEIYAAEKEGSERQGALRGILSDAARAIGEMMGLYEIVGDREVAEKELAGLAGLSVPAASTWLQSQYNAGYMDRDPISRRYRLWCAIPAAA
jgi:hypothetical protein